MEEKEINVEEIFTTLRRRKATIFWVVLIFLFSALYYNHKKRPVYRAMARVRLPGSNNITQIALQGMTTPWNDVPTQLAILKSLNIRKRVIEKLHLAIRLEDSVNSVFIDSLKVSPTLTPGHYILDIKVDSSYYVKDSTNNVLISGKVNKWSENDKIGLLIKISSDIKLPLKLHLRIRDIGNLLEKIGGHIKIQQEGNSFIARIEARDYSPEFAKKLADAYAESYVDYTLEDARYSARVLKDFLEGQVARVERQLKVKEDSLSMMEKEFDYFSTLMIKDGEETNKELLSNYLALVSEKYQAEMRYKEASALSETLTRKLKLSGGSSLMTGDYGGLIDKLLALEKRRAFLILNYSPEHPEAKRLEKKINALQKDISQKIHKGTLSSEDRISPKILSILQESEVNSILYSARLKAIQEVLKDYENKLSKVPDVSLTYFNLRRKIDALKQIYENLLLRLEEAKIEHASQIPDARVLDYALVPKSPFSPNKTLNLYLALVLGLFAGVLIAFLQEHLDKSIKDPETAEKIIDAPILAVIPHMDVPQPVIEPIGTCKDEKLIESLNRFKINLEFLRKTNPSLKTIGISSTASGEGKTILSLNLAQILALSGYNVLLVNADFVKPTQNKILGIPRNEEGLSEFLYRDSEKANILKTKLKGLDFLPSGKNKGYISSYLLRGQASKKFKELTSSYDIVIVDTAPIGVVSSTLLFANNLFDGLLLAIKYNFTNADFLSAVCKELVRNNVNIIGGVFNDFKTSQGYGYRYYYYGYYYHDTRKGIKHTIKRFFKRKKGRKK